MRQSPTTTDFQLRAGGRPGEGDGGADPHRHRQLIVRCRPWRLATRSGARAASRSARREWRALGLFWLLVVILLVVAGGTLQMLGPPAGAARSTSRYRTGIRSRRHRRRPAPAVAQPRRPSRRGAVRSAPSAAGAPPGRATPGPIADPDPALQEAVEGSTDRISCRGSPRMAAADAGLCRRVRSQSAAPTGRSACRRASD